MLKSWIFLVLAIATEVVGTLLMNASGHSGQWWMYGLMYFFISTSYFILSFALKRISVGIAIAIWEALGATLVTLISFLVLKEPVSTTKVIGIFLAVTGIILLNFGEAREDAKTHG